MISRRRFLAGAIAAPFVVRSGILMPIRPLDLAPDVVLSDACPLPPPLCSPDTPEPFSLWYNMSEGALYMADMARKFRRIGASYGIDGVTTETFERAHFVPRDGELMPLGDAMKPLIDFVSVTVRQTPEILPAQIGDALRVAPVEWLPKLGKQGDTDDEGHK